MQQTSEALRKLHPEKKGYSPRNLTYMCQFAKLYPIEIVEQLINADKELEMPTLEKVLSITSTLNEHTFTQEPLAQIQTIESEKNTITQEPPAQLQAANLEIDIITQELPAQIALHTIPQI